MKDRKMKEILYIGNIGTPNTALTIHAQNIAHLFYKLGYHTTFICNKEKNGSVIKEKSEVYEYYYTKKYINLHIFLLHNHTLKLTLVFFLLF